ncbi:MAG: hypothetical protein A2W17_01445 [Planctomycetes bacterium RBG_16_41_13]|nr:MAG: hypothetical protein A2W17_01445 [Planctomycetes bacterium RBG_16_41_13]
MDLWEHLKEKTLKIDIRQVKNKEIIYKMVKGINKTAEEICGKRIPGVTIETPSELGFTCP